MYDDLPMDASATPLVMDPRNDPLTIYSDDSGHVRYRGSACDLVLSANRTMKIINKKKRNILDVIDLRDVVGSGYMKKNHVFTLQIFRYKVPERSCFSGKEKLRQKAHLSIEFHVADHNILMSWSNAINCAAYNQLPLLRDEDGTGTIAPLKQKRTVVYVNPMSGKGIAFKRWEKVVKVMYREAGIDVRLVVTQRQYHCMEDVEMIQPDSIDFITTISGDGLIYEVINGLAKRPDGESVLKTLPIAALPGGSANGLAKSITFASHQDFSLINSTFIAIKGESAPLDLSITQTRTKSQYSFLMLGWGLVSDVDILSEFMRFLGETRLYVAAAYFIMAKRIYRGRLSMLIDPSYNKGSSLSYNPKQSNIPRPMELPPFSEPLVGENWMVIESDFVLVWVIQTSHTGETLYTGPGITLDDGVFTIVVARKMSRFDLLRLLITIDTGGHFQHPQVEVFKATAYRLEPLTDKGLYALDGEVVEYGPLQAVVKPAAARVLKL